MAVLYTRLLIFGAIQTFWISFLLSYFNLKLPLPDLGAQQWVRSHLDDAIESLPVGKRQTTRYKQKSEEEIVKPIIMTAHELAKYDGKKYSKGLYLSFLGKIYDVSKGNKHYGPGGGYSFFAGRDATKAFVTGDFTEEGLTDDITDLSEQDIMGMEEWQSFYENDYVFIGYLQGTYYDGDGKPTNKFMKFTELLNAAKKWQEKEKAETEKYPPCNSEWKEGKGGRVWCTKKSGGIERNWVGVPRRLFKPGSSQSRCACIKKEYVDNPNLKQFPDCPATSESCKTSDS